jgi:hypothetical protein
MDKSRSLFPIGAGKREFLTGWQVGTLPSQINYAWDSPETRDMVMSRAAMLRNKFYNEGQNSITDFNYPTGTAFVYTILKPLLKDDGNLHSIAMQVGGF